MFLKVVTGGVEDERKQVTLMMMHIWWMASRHSEKLDYMATHVILYIR